MTESANKLLQDRSEEGKLLKVYFEELIGAIYTGHYKKLNELLQNPVSGWATAQYESGYSVLHYTTFSGPCDEHPNHRIRVVLSEKILKACQQSGENPVQILSLTDSLGNTPLHHAAEYKRFGMVDLFISNKCKSPLVRRADSKTPLHLMADGKKQAALDSLKALLKYARESKALEVSDKIIFELGCIAAEAGAEIILKYLFDNENLNLNEFDKGMTVVHRCVIGGQKYSQEFLTELLKKAKMQQCENKFRDSLLHLVVRMGNIQFLKRMHEDKIIEAANLDNRNYYKETPFHSAVDGPDESGAIECIKLLLTVWKSMKLPIYQYKDFVALDFYGKTIIQKACEKRFAQLIQYFLNFVKFDSLPYPWFQHDMLCTIYEAFPTRLLSVMNQQIEIPSLDTNPSSSEVTFDFSCIIGYGVNFQRKRWNDTAALYCILGRLKNERQQVLMHPLVQTFLQMKWERFKYIALVWSAIQVLLVFLYNTLAIILYGNDDTSEIGNSTTAKERNDTNSAKDQFASGEDICLPIISAVILLLTLINVVKEVVQVLSYKCKYFMSPLNWVQLSFILIIFFVVSDGFNYTHRGLNSTAGFAAFGSFFSIFLLIRDFGRLPGCEGMYEVLVKVIKSSLKVLVFYLPCLLAFTLAFRILIRNNDSFHLPYGLIKILSMVIGELNYDDILTAQKQSESLGHFIQAMYLLFAFLAAIVLINLLIAFAVSDIQTLLADAETSRLESQLALIHGYENFLRITARITCKNEIERRFFLDSLLEKRPVESIPAEILQQLRNIKGTPENSGFS